MNDTTYNDNDDTNKEFTWWSSCSGHIGLVIKQDDAHRAYHQGDCYADSMALLETDYIKMQLDKLNINMVTEEVSNYGVNTDVLTDQEVRCYLIWLACGDIVDNEDEGATE